MKRFEGPTAIDCEQRCSVPKGMTLGEVPVPRHAWSDVMVCPNDDCERAFLVVPGRSES